MKRLAYLVFCGLVGLASPGVGFGSETRMMQSRVFFQDEAGGKLYWTDMARPTDVGQAAPHPVNLAEIEGFPKLDAENQSLVQMRTSGKFLLVAVRDNEDGEFQSGWVLIDTGVAYESHGDHGHWYYNHRPEVLATMLDDAQGNPAHVYCYDDVFYIANDRKNGFTRLDPKTIGNADGEAAIRSKAVFYSGGGGHITLAAAWPLVASTWMDRGGDNAGRVDICRIVGADGVPLVRTLNLNFAGLHGATAAANKFFFAPSDGVCWIEANDSLADPSAPITVQHLGLGKQGDAPLRTGAFTTAGDSVLLVSGKGDATFLGIIDAASRVPQLTKVAIPVDESSRASGPIVIQPRRQSPLAILFHDHAADANAPNVATLIQLDPDRDGSFGDAAVLKQIEVGSSDVVGHAGHHDLAGDAAGKFAWFTNPGDGTISVLSLEQLEVLATYRLSGKPARLVSVGGPGSGPLYDSK